MKVDIIVICDDASNGDLKPCFMKYSLNTCMFRGQKAISFPILRLSLHNRAQVLLSLIFKRPGGDLVEPQESLIRVLDEDILAILHSTHHIDNRPDNTPSVREVQVHLLGEFARVVAYNAQNDMFVWGLGRDT